MAVCFKICQPAQLPDGSRPSCQCRQHSVRQSKTIFPELPPRSEYAITPLGQTLIPIIDAMIEWGNRNADLFERKYGRKDQK